MVPLVHEAASVGFSRNIDRYQRGRPTYHPETAKRVAERYAGLIVELGAGSGIFTRQLVDEGLEVVALEPVVAMRTALAANVPEADVRVGTAEHIPIHDNSVDTVVAAQSFHWFDHGPALDEIQRILRPDGHLVTVWNVRDESVPWVAEFGSIIEEHAGDTPRHRSMRWRQAIRADERFAPIDEWRIPNPMLTTVDGVVDRALSTSFIASLPDDVMNEVADRIRGAIAPLGTDIEFPYRSCLQAWRNVAQ